MKTTKKQSITASAASLTAELPMILFPHKEQVLIHDKKEKKINIYLFYFITSMYFFFYLLSSD